MVYVLIGSFKNRQQIAGEECYGVPELPFRFNDLVTANDEEQATRKLINKLAPIIAAEDHREVGENYIKKFDDSGNMIEYFYDLHAVGFLLV